MIEVPLLHRRLSRDAVLVGIRAALGAGSVFADVVAIEGRKHATTSTEAGDASTTGGPAAPQRSRAAVVTLGARRHATLPVDERPAPSVRDYDQLLTRGRSSLPTGETAAGETRSS